MHEPRRGRHKIPRAQAARIERRFRRFLESIGMSQAGAAERMGISEKTVSRWGGREGRVPDVAAVLLAGDRLGLSPAYLLFGEGPERLGGARDVSGLSADIRNHLVSSLVALGADARAADALVPEGGQILRDLLAEYGDVIREAGRLPKKKGSLAWAAFAPTENRIRDDFRKLKALIEKAEVLAVTDVQRKLRVVGALSADGAAEDTLRHRASGD